MPNAMLFYADRFGPAGFAPAVTHAAARCTPLRLPKQSGPGPAGVCD